MFMFHHLTSRKLFIVLKIATFLHSTTGSNMFQHLIQNSRCRACFDYVQRFINNAPFSVQFYIFIFHRSMHCIFLSDTLIPHNLLSFSVCYTNHSFSSTLLCFYNWRIQCSQLPIEIWYFVILRAQNILCYGNVCCFHLSSVYARCFSLGRIFFAQCINETFFVLAWLFFSSFN